MVGNEHRRAQGRGKGVTEDRRLTVVVARCSTGRGEVAVDRIDGGEVSVAEAGSSLMPALQTRPGRTDGSRRSSESRRSSWTAWNDGAWAVAMLTAAARTRQRCYKGGRGGRGEGEANGNLMMSIASAASFLSSGTSCSDAGWRGGSVETANPVRSCSCPMPEGGGRRQAREGDGPGQIDVPLKSRATVHRWPFLFSFSFISFLSVSVLFSHLGNFS